jgi:hypothetical protein
MILEGMEKEGLDIVAGVRDRYNGENRNPWNEMECGSNYARSMAAYALLLAYSGFAFDMTKLALGFAPRRDGSYFWSLNTAWGIFERSEAESVLKVLHGSQRLKRLTLDSSPVQSAALDGKVLTFNVEGETLVFTDELLINEGGALILPSAA